MESATCIEVNCWLPLTECTRTSTEEHIHRSLSLDDKRSFPINNLNIISCFIYKSTYSEPHRIFYFIGAQRKAEGEETGGLYLEQGCSVKSKRRQWLSESLISILNLCISAPSVVAAAGEGGIAFLQAPAQGAMNWIETLHVPYWSYWLPAELQVILSSFSPYSPFQCLSLVFPSSHHYSIYASFIYTVVPNPLVNSQLTTYLSLSCCCPLFFSYFFEDHRQRSFS